jgi:hypothetical protein
MLRKICYYAFIMYVAVLLAPAVWAAEDTASLKIPPNQSQVKELRGLGLLVGRGESWEKVEKGWRSFLEKAKDVDVDAAANYVTQEASVEASRNQELAKKKLDQLTVLKGAVIEELGRTRAVLADAQQRKKRTMINRNEFEVTQSEPFKVILKPKEVLSFEADVAQYVRELEVNLRSIDTDVRRSTAELATMTQRREDVMKSFSEVREKLLEIGLSAQEGGAPR